MSRILDLARTATTEAVTESATAEVAIAIIGIAVVVFAVGVVRGGRTYSSAALRGAGLVIALAGLGVQVHAQGWLTDWDGPVTSWFVAHRTPPLDTAAVVVTDLGSPVATVALALVVAALLARRARSPIPAVVLIGTVGAAAVASTALKQLIGRDRPPAPIQLVMEADYSFPSGHVTGTATLLGMTAVILTIGRSRYVRAVAAAIVVVGVVVVAATRVYLGVHWLTDVIAGALLAAVFVTIGSAAQHRLTEHPGPLSQIRRERPDRPTSSADRTPTQPMGADTAADDPCGVRPDRGAAAR
ncbi:phosphatase PAP2 family protein [Rhodococcus sp. TAF43]|uniref:phosphatase PAP2 family protein n=1 Tax=Rhodococcus sp. TAF43 TaxID=3237483 RepID=UPI003F9C12EC